MMMLCSLIPIGPYFGSGDLSCSRISSLIQIEAKHIKHSNEEQYDYGAGSSLSLCAWKNSQKVHVEEVALISIAISSKSEWFFSMV